MLAPLPPCFPAIPPGEGLPFSNQDLTNIARLGARFGCNDARDITAEVRN
jgi:hypothetical protein